MMQRLVDMKNVSLVVLPRGDEIDDVDRISLKNGEIHAHASVRMSMQKLNP